MAGLTSQPSANSLYYAMKGGKREVRADIDALENYRTTGKMFVNTIKILKVA